MRQAAQNAANKQQAPAKVSFDVDPGAAKFRSVQTDMARRLATSELIGNYVAHCVDPEHTNPVGIPDQFIGSRPSGLVCSVMPFDLTVNMGPVVPATNNGRFGFIVQPHMGDSSNQTRFKAAVVDTTLGWPTDFSVSNAFLRVDAGTSLTVDPAFKQLLMPAVSYFEASGTNAAGVWTAGPLGAGGPPDGTSGLGTWTIDPATADQENPRLGAARFVNFPVVGRQTITLPPGQWTIILVTTFFPVGGVAVCDYSLVAQVPGSSHISVQGNTAIFVGIVTQMKEYNVSVFRNAQVFDLTWTNQPTTDWDTEITIYSSWARPDQLQQPSVMGYPVDGGMVKEYVPVAMSVLVTFIAPELQLAGDIGCIQLPPGECSTNVFTSMPTIDAGNPLFIESLRKMSQRYDGALKSGCYAVWGPSGSDDMQMLSPSDNINRHWPCICVSGVCTGSMTGLQKILRVTIVTTYQYTTDIVIFPLAVRPGDTASREAAFRLLNSFPKYAANGTHLENIRALAKRCMEFLGGGFKWYQSHKTVLDPVLQLGASMLI